MQITVRPFGMVRTALGRKEIALDLPGDACVRDAIDRIIQTTGPESRALLLTAEGEALKVRAVVDGKAALMDTPLHDGAELSLMFAIGGGAWPYSAWPTHTMVLDSTIADNKRRY